MREWRLSGELWEVTEHRFIQAFPKSSMNLPLITPLKDKIKSCTLRTVLLKGIKHVLSMISLRMMNKENGETEMDIINYKVGSRLQQLAQLHGSYYTVDAFIEAIEN